MPRLENPFMTVKIYGDNDIIFESKDRVDDLYMYFEIVKDLEEDPNECTFTISNLNNDYQSQIYQAANKSAPIEIYASTAESTDLILMYVGEIDYAISTDAKPGFETKILCTSQQNNHRSKYLDIEFKAGTPKRQIVDKFISAIGLPRGKVDQIQTSGIVKSQSYIGSAYHSLQRFCYQFIDKYCYILDGTINITDVFEPENVIPKTVSPGVLAAEPMPTSRVDRGLTVRKTLLDISVKKEFEPTPRKTIKRTKRKKEQGASGDPIEFVEADTNIKGMDFEMFLQPDLNPDDIIKIAELPDPFAPAKKEKNRLFRLTEVIHTGNTENFDDWTTNLITDEYSDDGGAIAVAIA